MPMGARSRLGEARSREKRKRALFNKASRAALFLFFAVNYCGPTRWHTPPNYINLIVALYSSCYSPFEKFQTSNHYA
jgi:hypothetical protein